MRSFRLYFLLLVVATACSQKKTEEADSAKSSVLFSSSFEGLEGWLPENPSLTQEKAHTGKYSVKVDSNIEYGVTYINKLGRLSPTRINKFHLKAWTFLTKPGNAALVFQIMNPDQSGTNAFYEKIDLEKVDAWTLVEKDLTLPAVVDPNSQVRVYLWRANATGPVYLDDIELTVAP
ncbi:hypothetical protein [Hymenobacter metallicola]|uniref:CBM-cenC domain-containing protein n=1 Tax=Hymenobacter metallicola TaxID=2563114 RepID=A0A4Z0Q8S6_9BACT|nr:hypothetical protein [Hymenobacter metallicola]TGE26498.1 hypothetical protein E5K02_17040 [Hymenobacter metallicola]